MPQIQDTQKTGSQSSSPISSVKREQGSLAIQGKAQMLVERLFSLKEEQKELKNALKAYQVSSEKLEKLKQTRRELTAQVNDEKLQLEAKLQGDKDYQKLREQMLDVEEKMALSKQDLRLLLQAEAFQKGFFEVELEVNGAPVKLQTQAKVALYFNGKEEK